MLDVVAIEPTRVAYLFFYDGPAAGIVAWYKEGEFVGASRAWGSDDRVSVQTYSGDVIVDEYRSSPLDTIAWNVSHLLTPGHWRVVLAGFGDIRDRSWSVTGISTHAVIAEGSTFGSDGSHLQGGKFVKVAAPTGTNVALAEGRELEFSIDGQIFGWFMVHPPGAAPGIAPNPVGVERGLLTLPNGDVETCPCSFHDGLVPGRSGPGSYRLTWDAASVDPIASPVIFAYADLPIGAVG